MWHEMCRKPVGEVRRQPGYASVPKSKASIKEEDIPVIRWSTFRFVSFETCRRTFHGWQHLCTCLRPSDALILTVDIFSRIILTIGLSIFVLLLTLECKLHHPIFLHHNLT